MLYREIETPACTTSSKFTRILWSQIPILISGHRHSIHRTPDINIYPASLHCRGMNYLSILIYICLYLICPRQTSCLGYKAGLGGTRRSQLTPRKGDYLNIALNVGLWTPPAANSLCLINNEIAMNMEIKAVSLRWDYRGFQFSYSRPTCNGAALLCCNKVLLYFETNVIHS